MSDNIGLKITDFYCNGFAGRRYDLTDSIIEAEGRDWIVIRTTEGQSIHLDLKGYDKQEYIDNWTNLNQNKDDKAPEN
tara:strand:+ start:23 stop:256 length:234 start_codon:yes stop_codon:yes gene_type:complete